MGWVEVVGAGLDFLNLSNYNTLKIRIAIIIVLIALAILFLMILIWIFSSIINRIRNKKKIPKKKKVKKIKTPEEKRDLFDKKIKNYFKNYLHEEREMNYSELAEKLKEKNKQDMSNFCQRMNYYLYSKKAMNEQDINDLNKHFKNLISPKKLKEKQTNIKKIKAKHKIKKHSRKIKRKHKKR